MSPQTLTPSLAIRGAVPADDEGRRPFGSRFSDRFENDASFRMWLLKWFWLIGLVMMLGGYVLMILILLGRNPFV